MIPRSLRTFCPSRFPVKPKWKIQFLTKVLKVIFPKVWVVSAHGVRAAEEPRLLAPVREKCPYLLPSVPISTPPQQHNQYAPPAPASAQARPPTPPQPPDSLRTGFWTTTGGADWTDLELMPPDCALTGGYAPVSGDPPQTAPGLCASDQELPMANKSRQGRFRCVKIQIQVFVTAYYIISH